MPADDEWWREAVVYQVYPRSWQDSDADGVGDLPGIVARLDHLVALGADAVWVSPFYPSPMADFGYDVADYEGVDPLFGTVEDAEGLIAEAHARGLKVILDFVPSHSSDRHPWFREARASPDNPKRDWYIWADPGPDGGVPNNWMSASGGPAWTLDQATGQFYLHSFLPQQPDLNWRNPEVRDAMLGAMETWLDRGVDGFRLDVVYRAVKDEHLRSDPVNPDFDPETDPPFAAVIPEFSADRPEVMPLVVQPMRRLADRHGALLIGEIYLPFERLVTYYGSSSARGVHLPFNFSLIFAEWTAEALAGLITEYEGHLPPDGWPNWVLGNHDQPRLATRLGDARARAALVLLLSLRGTPTLYYGEEIGMRDAEIPPDRIRDPWEINMPGLGEGRDPCRTPMRWSDAPNAGFCPEGVEPWLPMGSDLAAINVAAQDGLGASTLTLVRDALALRRARPALRLGAQSVEARDGVLILTRGRDGERVVAALNLSGAEAPRPGGRVLLSTHPGGSDVLRPDEAVIVEP